MTELPYRHRWLISLPALAPILAVQLLCAQQTETSQAVPPFRWPKTITEVEQLEGMSASVIGQFVDAVRPPASAHIEVGAFRFVPMEHDTICLVVDADNSQRTSFSGVAVVCPGTTPGAVQCTVLYSDASAIPTGELVDLDGDGQYELVTGDTVGGYQGAQTLSYLAWYTVYRVTGGIPRDVSARYRKFYVAKLLPQTYLVSHLLDSACAVPAEEAAILRAKVQFLRDSFDRRILGNPTAGLGHAIDWAGSSSANLETLAIDVLKEIDAPSALAELKKLANSPHRAVAGYAAAVLEAKNAAHR